jgi:hypothetical protein
MATRVDNLAGYQRVIVQFRLRQGMSDQRLRRLQDIKSRLEQIVAELDDLLNEVRDSDGDPARYLTDNLPWILQLSQQREVLATVATLITDPTFDSAISGGKAIERDGH